MTSFGHVEGDILRRLAEMREGVFLSVPVVVLSYLQKTTKVCRGSRWNQRPWYLDSQTIFLREVGLGDIALHFDAWLTFPTVFKLVENDVDSRKAFTELSLAQEYNGPAWCRTTEEF